MNIIVLYIRENFVPLCMVFVPSGLFFGPMPYNASIYYCLLFLLACMSVFKGNGMNIVPILFLFACALSIVFGDASPIFRSWERLGLFVLLVTAYFPVFKSNYIDNLRSVAFPLMLGLMIFCSVGSFVAYFFGINYMTKAFSAFADSVTVDTVGWFGGLTYQSMMLGPICAVAMTTLVWILIEKTETKRGRISVGLTTFATMCCLMLTASRSANIAGVIGCLSVLFIKYRYRLGRLIKIGFLVTLLGIALSPMYMSYADKVLSKQKDNVESGSTFASRQSRWEHRLAEFSKYPLFGYGFVAVDTDYINEYQASTGVIEPGSSWLAILSMTGVCGAACFICMFVSTCQKLLNEVKFENDDWALLHLGILSVFSVHFIAEGYIFSGGGALCFLFWFFFGCAYSYSRDLINYKMLLDD